MAIDINITTPNLQEVTDSGNTTSNDIEFADNRGVLLKNTSRLKQGTIDSGAGGGIAQICAVGYELKWEAGSQYVMDGNGVLIREVNHKFNIIPEASNDDTQGFYVGSRWILDNGDVYVCTDSTSTAAVWQKLPSVSDLVPYTGATADVDLGEFELKSGQIEFDQTPTGTAGVAVMRWNDTDGTVDLGLKGGNVTLQLGQEQVLRVVNKTATNINLLEANYQAVRVTGAQGQRLKVDLAQATTDLLSAETIGLVTETINNNQEGFITTSGLIRNINTTGSLQGETWLDGDILYLSSTTAGRVTNVKPSAPNHLIIIGYVVSAHITQGSIFVKVDNGYELDELHNVSITSVANNDLLQYDSAASLWKNESLANAGVQPTLVSGTNIKTVNGTSLLGSGDITISGGGGITVGTTAVTSGTVGRVFFQGTGDVVQQSASLFWDNTNARLGVGATPASTVRLDVRAQGALSTDIVQRWRNSADTANLGMITGNGAMTIGTYTNPSTQLTISSQLNFGMYVEGITGISAANQSGAGSRYAIQALGRSGVVGATTYGIRTGADSSSASTTNYGIQSYAYNGTTNYAGYFDATGGTTNYALYIQRGDILLGNATTNKIAFWNKTPIVQPTTAITAATFVANTSGILNDTATFDGYTIGQVVKALRNIGILA